MDEHLPVLCPTTPITMDDNVSINSSDSVTTSGEYEIVPELIDCGADPSGMLETGSKPPTQSPKLAIFNNGDMAELAKNMHEVIHDMDDTFVGRQQTTSVVGAVADSSTVSGLASDNTVAMGTTGPTRIAGQGKHRIEFSFNIVCTLFDFVKSHTTSVVVIGDISALSKRTITSNWVTTSLSLLSAQLNKHITNYVVLRSNRSFSTIRLCEWCAHFHRALNYLCMLLREPKCMRTWLKPLNMHVVIMCDRIIAQPDRQTKHFTCFMYIQAVVAISIFLLKVAPFRSKWTSCVVSVSLNILIDQHWLT